jgi:cytochrome c-type biogenesis protein CcmH/NrfG
VDLPAALQAVVMRALEKDRARRFSTAAEFRQALERVEQAEVSVGRARLVLSRLPALARRTAAALQQRESRLPFAVRRWVRPGLLALVVAGLVTTPLLCRHQGVAPTATPPAPRPLEPALEAPLRRIEEVMGRGQLAEARMLLMQQISRHPDNGRVHLLLGHLELAEKNPSGGLTAYQEAVRLDPGLRGDAALLVSVRRLLSDRKLGPEALDFLIKRVGRPAGRALAEVASEDRRAELRQAARTACQTLGCAASVDLVRSHALDLQQGKTCEERRVAVQALARTKDPRAIEALKRARHAGRGFLDGILGGGNQCIRKDIDIALKELGG